MKTSLDIPEEELSDLLRHTKARTKREAIITAVREFNRRRRLAALIKRTGRSRTFMSVDELLRLRRRK
jgi:hypothetical protein